MQLLTTYYYFLKLMFYLQYLKACVIRIMGESLLLILLALKLGVGHEATSRRPIYKSKC